MSCCTTTGKNIPTVSVTLKEYPAGCQCSPPPPPPSGGTESESASRLDTPREIRLTGAITGSTYFDGSKDVEIPVTIQAITNIQLEELLK